MANDPNMGEAISDLYADAERKANAEVEEFHEGRFDPTDVPVTKTDDELRREWVRSKRNAKIYVPSRTLKLLHDSVHDLRVVQGSVGCLAGECRIWTERGLERMDELYARGEPFKVLSRRTDGTTGFETATAPFVKGCEPLLKVTVEGRGSFRGAAAHLVLNPRGVWKRLSEISSGSYLSTVDEKRLWTWETVKSVETETVPEIYYDLTVESTGNYIGEWGIVHHNSGKSHGCEVDIPLRCATQRVSADGHIHNRCLMARGTYQELKQTTFNMWMHLFPDTDIALSSPIQGRLEMQLGNRKSIIELLGFGMDMQSVEAKLRSNDFSIAFANEVQYIGYDVIEVIQERLGRYPYSDMVPQGYEIEGYFKNLGLTCDTNAPVEGSWLYERAQIVRDPTELFLFQPPAMFRTWDTSAKRWVYEENRGQRWKSHGIAAAENVENLNEGWNYYWSKTKRSDDYIRRNVLNEYGHVLSGTPVYPEFQKDRHVPASGVPMPPRGTRLYCGMDLGRTPRAVFGYYAPNGGVRIPLILAKDCGVQMFAESVMRPQLAARGIHPSQVTIFPDPAGENKGEQVEATSVEILRTAGFDVAMPVLKNNDPFTRTETVRQALTRSAIDGDPYVAIDPLAEELVRALAGGYTYAVVRQAGGQSRTSDKPDKGPYSHVANAAEYLLVGLKYGRREDRIFGGGSTGAFAERFAAASDGRDRGMFC